MAAWRMCFHVPIGIPQRLIELVRSEKDKWSAHLSIVCHRTGVSGYLAYEVGAHLVER